MNYVKLQNEKWTVDDREPFRCIREGYQIVTLDEREYVGIIRLEKDAEYIVRIHNQYLGDVEKRNELV